MVGDHLTAARLYFTIHRHADANLPKVYQLGVALQGLVKGL